MANVFVCHRGADAALAERLAAEIRTAGHSVWLDIWEVTVGDQIIERMDSGLAGTSYLVLCYSSAGMAPWMNIEWTSSLARQMNGEGIKVLPVRLSGSDAPAILKGTKYADLLSDWHHGMQELLRAIK